MSVATSRTDVVKVPLPDGVGVGLVVGRGGANTRWLHIHSGGAHITVNDQEVVIRAKDAHVRARAVQLVRRQLEAMQRFGIHDSLSPCRLDYVLLENSFGSDPRVRFAPRNDEVAAAVVKKDKLFELVPVSPRSCSDGPAASVGGGADSGREESPLVAEVACWVVAPGAVKRGGGGDDINAANSPVVLLKAAGADSEDPVTPQDHVCPRDQDQHRSRDRAPRVSSSPRPASPASPQGRGGPAAAAALRFHAARSSGVGGICPLRPQQQLQLLTPAARTLAAAARLAAAGGGQEPGFDALRMRFHLGKHLFRNLGARAVRAELTVPELEGGGPGRGEFQSVFSNYIPTDAVPRVTAWLTEVLGFSLVDTKTTASLHVINQELNVHYSIALAMERGDDSTAVLRKVKAGGSRYHSVALLGAPDQLDLRLRLVAQSGQAHSADAHATARRVAAAVRAEGFEGFTRSKRGLPRNRHLEYARRKTKFVYEGSFPGPGQVGCGGQRLRVSVTEVQDDKGTHFEISGCLPDVDAALRHTLRPPQQQQHRLAAPAVEDSSSAWVPEWRRGRSTGGASTASGRSSGGGSSAYAATSTSTPASARYDSGGRRVYDSASSSPVRAPTLAAAAAAATATASPASPPSTPVAATPASDVDMQWAVDALTQLSEFITELNRHLSDSDV